MSPSIIYPMNMYGCTNGVIDDGIKDKNSRNSYVDAFANRRHGVYLLSVTTINSSLQKSGNTVMLPSPLKAMHVIGIRTIH